MSALAFTPGPFATDADIERAVAADREWRTAAMPSAPYQPRVLVGTNAYACNRRPFKKGGYWCARNAGTARLLRPINCASDNWPELLVFPPFYGRGDEDAERALAKARGEQ